MLMPYVTVSNFVTLGQIVWLFRKFWCLVSRLSRSLKVTGTNTDRLAAYKFLLLIHSNHGPIRGKQRFLLRMAYFFHPFVFHAPAEGVPLGIFNGGSIQKLVICYQMVQRVWRYVHSLQYNTRVECDGQTDRFAITISRSAYIGKLMCNKNIWSMMHTH